MNAPCLKYRFSIINSWVFRYQLLSNEFHSIPFQFQFSTDDNNSQETEQVLFNVAGKQAAREAGIINSLRMIYHSAKGVRKALSPVVQINSSLCVKAFK